MTTLQHSVEQRRQDFQREQLESQRRMMQHYGMGENPWPNQQPIPAVDPVATVSDIAMSLRQWARYAQTGVADVTVDDAEQQELLRQMVPELVTSGRVRITASR